MILKVTIFFFFWNRYYIRRKKKLPEAFTRGFLTHLEWPAIFTEIETVRVDRVSLSNGSHNDASHAGKWASLELDGSIERFSNQEHRQSYSDGECTQPKPQTPPHIVLQIDEAEKAEGVPDVEYNEIPVKVSGLVDRALVELVGSHGGHREAGPSNPDASQSHSRVEEKVLDHARAIARLVVARAWRRF